MTRETGGLTALASDTFLVDLREGGTVQRTAGYLIRAPRPALIETGGKSGVGAWLEALEQHGIPRDEVAYIVVTHIHLDHAAGAGTLARLLPRAQVVVHPRGARHLQNPGRLVEGARSIFGDRLESLFGLPEPVPAERTLVPEANQTLDLGGGHRLRFIEAPGHARHQYMILDEGTGALVAGDELGVRYPSLSARIGRDYLLPSTAPNQFNPDAMLRSARAVPALRPAVMLLPHFAAAQMTPEEVAQRMEEQVPLFVACGVVDGRPATPEETRRRLAEHIRRDAEAYGLDWAEVEPAVALDLHICSIGIADYHQRRAQGKA
ncbi:Zn-dependent hydrolase, including glyoxylase [Thermaerobacter marianensis DSM 12885]|uniref:Zn-dependent hydrolase, including glyoxylase n=1 Tax=Thermaerobacter marianensis (strain ATCC 700841 / DSM 12885 / JCM 10246 / 7p75a) TaxID=644966 RepID=E6SJ68_THEM7|nr:MBL fold metallo-hydrolase [Thermaerobacter marianensis]ADU52092.1 Zn-dependent hydrolase, including glyoxylase [Thermaerobacter marianensis DSM 12885]